MGRKKITEEEMQERANVVCSFMSRTEWISRLELAELACLTEGQLASTIKYLRRACESDHDMIRFYPISGKRGYKLPNSISDYLQCYVPLLLVWRSIKRTIEPMRRHLLLNGYREIDIVTDTILDADDSELNEYMADEEWFGRYVEDEVGEIWAINE